MIVKSRAQQAFRCVPAQTEHMSQLVLEDQIRSASSAQITSRYTSPIAHPNHIVAHRINPGGGVSIARCAGAVVADSCDCLPYFGFSRLKTQLVQTFYKRSVCFRAVQRLILDNHLHRLSHSPPVV